MPTVELFESMLKRWYFWATHSRLQPIIDAARTIKAHWEGVVQWKKSHIDNGLLEGLNSLIQAAKAKARGFSTFRYFRIGAFLVTGRLDFTRLNKPMYPFKTYRKHLFLRSPAVQYMCSRACTRSTIIVNGNP